MAILAFHWFVNTIMRNLSDGIFDGYLIWEIFVCVCCVGIPLLLEIVVNNVYKYIKFLFVRC